MRWLFLGIASVAACTFPRPPDVADDVPIDAAVDARPDLVTGTDYQRYQTRAGTVDVPFDLSMFSVQAMVPSTESPTGFITRTGVGHADGTFAIEGVTPDAPYFLKVNRAHFLTDQHQIKLRQTMGYRTGVAPSTAPTPVVLTITDMPPTASGDYLSIESAFANIVETLPGATLTAGQTQSTTSGDWMTSGTGEIPDATAGDDLVVHQRRTMQTTDGRFVQSIVATAALDPAAVVDGQAASFTTALTVPSTRLTLVGALGRVPFEAGHSPLATSTSVSVQCNAIPRPTVSWTPEGGAAFGPAVVYATSIPNWLATGVTALSLAGAYPDPYPTSWTRLCTVAYRRNRPVRLPGASATPALLFTGSFRIADPSLVTVSPLAPPAAIMVEGQTAEYGGMIHNDGSPIDISWSGVAQATQYLVEVQQLRPGSGGGTSTRMAAAIASTDPRLEIPADLLTGSDFVAFSVTAVSAPNHYAAGELLPEGSPGASATAVTAMFRYSATCGNGTIDLGEDCDGASASCDVDCTAAMCGDGLRNAAAGEICDSIEDTIGCDADCTPNVCGDGHVNPNTDQCDDAGTMSGDGCSATCRTE